MGLKAAGHKAVDYEEEFSYNLMCVDYEPEIYVMGLKAAGFFTMLRFYYAKILIMSPKICFHYAKIGHVFSNQNRSTDCIMGLLHARNCLGSQSC